MPLGLGLNADLGRGEFVAAGGGGGGGADQFVYRHDNGDNTFAYRWVAADDLASPTTMATSNEDASSSLQGGVFHPGTGWIVFPVYGGASNSGTVEVYDVATGTLTDICTNQNIGVFGADVRDTAVSGGANDGVQIVAMYAAGDDQILGWFDAGSQASYDVLIQNYTNVDHEGLAICEDGIGTTQDLDVYYNYDTGAITPRVGGYDLPDDRNDDLFQLHDGQGGNQSHLIIGINASEWSGSKGVVITVAHETVPELALFYVDDTGSTTNLTFAEITGTIQALTHNYNGDVYVYDNTDGLHKLALEDSAGNPTLTYTEKVATVAQFPTFNGRGIICVPAGTTIN